MKVVAFCRHVAPSLLNDVCSRSFASFHHAHFSIPKSGVSVAGPGQQQQQTMARVFGVVVYGATGFTGPLFPAPVTTRIRIE